MLSSFARNALSTKNADNLSAATISLGTAICRETGACNDNGTCRVRFRVTARDYPAGSYFTIGNKTGTGDVVVTDIGLPGEIEYRETNNTQSITFDLQLRNSAGTILATSNETISHDAGWAAIASCEPLTIDSQSSTTCYSCLSFTVNVPAGQSRQVIITNNFQSVAEWAAGFCNTGADLEVIAPLTESISATKSYDLGIDAAQGGLNSFSSSISVQVKDGGSVVGFFQLDRNHTDGIC